MATYFGEVVYPSSRAFWDEEEEDEEAEENEGGESSDGLRKKVEFRNRWSGDRPSSIKKLLIVEGQMISDFVKECLCSGSEGIGTVEDESGKSISVFHKVTQDLYLCVVGENFEAKLAGELVNEISDILASAELVIGITFMHISKYKCTDPTNLPSFMRVLGTTQVNDSHKVDAQTLEQPNIVFGVSAGALSYAELLGHPALLYVLYADSFCLDSISAEPLVKVLGEIGQCDIRNVTFAGKDFFNKGNLYM